MTGGRTSLHAPKRAAALSALLIGLLLAGLLGASAPRAHADPISAKRAQAQTALDRLQQLDAAAQRANSRYQAADEKLRLVEHQLRVNRQALGVVHGNFRRAQHTLMQRLVAIYTSEDQQSSLAVILGARSLDDLISRIETVDSVSKQNSALIHEVLSLQHAMVVRRGMLRRERARQADLVATRAAERNRIEAQRASAQRLYSSVRVQIQHMIAAQQAAQAAAARAARAAATAQAAAPQGSFGVGSPVRSSIPGDRYSSVVGIAMQYLGVKYVWGGASPSGFDCSGLVMYVYAQVGVSLPHYTVAQWNYPDAVSVPRNELEPGDLVFFAGLGHVGIYVGNGQFIHAPHTGDVVRIDSLNEGWYSSEYDGAKRILG
ncbi:MAG TPA: NlpC/P60 family protein [Gaiellaceae bacterium]|nr:NlpC/P60 family protein [Gaiellaceae bacterium]